MPEFDAADVREYYDRHTGSFIAHGEGGAAGALHRAVWGPGVDDADAAVHYVENRLLARLEASPAGEPPAHVVDLGCGVGGSLCHLAARLPIRGTGLTLSAVQARHAERRIRGAGLSRPRPVPRSRLLRSAAGSAGRRPRLRDRVAGPRAGPRPVSSPPAPGSSGRGGLLAICDDFLRPAEGPAARRTVARFRRGVASQYPAPSTRAARPRGPGRVRASLHRRPHAASAARASPGPRRRPVHRGQRMAAPGPDAVRASCRRNRPADLSGEGMDRIRSRALPPGRRHGNPGAPRARRRRFRGRDAALSAAWRPTLHALFRARSSNAAHAPAGLRRPAAITFDVPRGPHLGIRRTESSEARWRRSR